MQKLSVQPGLLQGWHESIIYVSGAVHTAPQGMSTAGSFWQAVGVSNGVPLTSVIRYSRKLECYGGLQVGERSQRATVRLQASRATVSVRVKDIGERAEALRPDAVRCMPIVVLQKSHGCVSVYSMEVRP